MTRSRKSQNGSHTDRLAYHYSSLSHFGSPLTEGRGRLSVLVGHVAGVLAVPLGGDVPAVLLFVYLGNESKQTAESKQTCGGRRWRR